MQRPALVPGVSLLLMFLGVASALARPVPRDTPLYLLMQPADESREAGGPVAGLSAGSIGDTVRFGGTVWAADSLRWEAIRDSVWTFDSGVGSAIPAVPGSDKPAGYHSLMEGWSGLDLTRPPDLPWFQRSSLCAIGGSFSLHAGVSQAEADSLCYTSGAGYGNDWDLVMEHGFDDPGTGAVTLSFDYAVDAEPGYDYVYVEIDTTENGSAPPVLVSTYNALVSGHVALPLTRGTHLRSTPGPIVLRLRAESDPSYSDEDGLYPTACGLATFDNIQFSGAISASFDFESGLDGWGPALPGAGVGDFSNLAALADLPPTAALCPCGLRDSILVFFDTSALHPLDQENLALSPWIDLRRSGDVGRPGRVIEYDIYSEMPLANYNFVILKARWYPWTCPTTGVVRTSPLRDEGLLYFFGEVPFCPPRGQRRMRDFTAVIDAQAEQVQMAVGVIDLCRTAPFGLPCTGITNTTPWFDNVSLGVYGTQNAPIVTVAPTGRLQDNFASDGSRGLESPGRVDVNFLRTGGSTVLGDTLVASGDGGNTEVRLVFRVTPGPFTSAATLAAWSGKWTSEPALGPGWYSSRMDTAEVGGGVSAGRWMSTFHEDDPGFSGNDRSPDPIDGWQLANEILPDRILTPGSRIDYFVAARFRPPDPRNPGGNAWSVYPDTTGGARFEMEILPSSMAADSTWNCTLYVNHHADREFELQALEEAGLTAALGPGGTNPEGTRFDRWDVNAASQNQLSLARPTGGYSYAAGGTTWSQALFYDIIAWHSGSLSANQLTNGDGSLLRLWLQANRGNCRWLDECTNYEVSRRFWGSGDGLAASMHNTGTGSEARNFLNNWLGATYTCGTIRSANCPSGTGQDTTACLPLATAGSPHFFSTQPSRLRGDGCPGNYSFDLLAANPALSTAAGNLSYVKLGVEQTFASVSNVELSIPTRDFKTVLDGFAVGRLRNAASPGCADLSAAPARAQDVFAWFGSCPFPIYHVPPSAVPPPDPATPWQLALKPPVPNPGSGPVRIPLVQGADRAPLALSILDVTGRQVRVLVEGPLEPGPHEILWDGRDENGHPVAAGLYFVRLTGGARSLSHKLVVIP